jgi:hypothetical protein
MTTNAELTQMCRLIFGDIVSKAYFQEENLKYKDPSASMMEVRSQQVLDWCCDIFIVEFTNGSIVQFENSEWAYLTRLNNANLQQT